MSAGNASAAGDVTSAWPGAGWPPGPHLGPPPQPVLLIAEEGSLSDLPEGVEVIWLKPGKPMPLVVSR